MVFETLERISLIVKKDLKIQFRWGATQIFFFEFFVPVFIMIFTLLFARDPNIYISVIVGVFCFQLMYDITDKIAWAFTSWEGWAVDNLLSVPIKDSEIIVSKSLFGFSFGILRALLLLIIGYLIYPSRIAPNLLALFLYTFLSLVVYASIGLIFLGIWFYSRILLETSIKIFYFLSQLLFGFYFDPSLLPSFLQIFSKIFPIYYLVKGIKDAIIFGVFNTSCLFVPILWLIFLIPISLKIYRFGRLHYYSGRP